MKRFTVYSAFFFLFLAEALGQVNLSVTLVDKDEQPVSEAEVFIEPDNLLKRTNAKGQVKLSFPKGEKLITIHKIGFTSIKESVNLNADTTLYFTLSPLSQDLVTVEVVQEADYGFGMTTMNSIDGMAIYAGKKNEVLIPDQIEANKAINSARQVFARIPGVNIWESDGAGIQLGIGVRGLSPNRTANINVRQNGYDISADALGYPESYYTPPMEALERIEFVRGAASLQYGTQFGGMLNFVMKDGDPKKKFAVNTRQTVGSFGLFNSFNSIGGTSGKSSYYGFYQYKRGDGWRDNSGFEAQTVYGRYGYQLTENWKVSLDYTHMSYLTQQAGGLTDQQFEDDPRQSFRDRNYFKVNWNLASVKLNGKFSSRSSFDLRVFGLKASRQSLGYLGAPNRQDDPSSPRDLINGEFDNVGAETRYLHRYSFFTKQSILLVGMRAYRGNTLSEQGNADATDEPNFEFTNQQFVDKSQYDFDNINFALFAEQVIYINENFTVTPGVRYEYIDTRADGYYMNYTVNQVGDTLETTRNDEDRARSRNILLGGIGMSYKTQKGIEVYGNISQNYRAINYGDIRIDNPSLRIDPNIQDERGYNADLGVRGGNKMFRFDMSVYYMVYKDRIGSIQMRDPDTFQFYRYRTNIANSTAIGTELYADWSPIRQKENKPWGLSIFGNFSYTYARYNSEQDLSVDGNEVELTPEYTFRTGVRVAWKDLSATWQLSLVDEQFTDATNAEFTPNGINGLIPSYTVMDFSMAYKIKIFEISAGVNNLANTAYFTRRADGYPGPGIIPSDGLGLYLTVGAKF